MGHPPRYSEQRLLPRVPPWHNLNSPQRLPHIKPHRRGGAADVYRTTANPPEVRRKWLGLQKKQREEKGPARFTVFQQWVWCAPMSLIPNSLGLNRQTAEQEGRTPGTPLGMFAKQKLGTILVPTMHMPNLTKLQSKPSCYLCWSFILL